MQHILIATLGESPVVITAMHDKLIEKNLPISKVIVLHPQEETIRYAVDLIRDVLKDTCEVIAEPLPFDDANSEAEAFDFLHILYMLLNNAQKSGDTIYLSLAGGRKNMSALMAILVPLFPCVKGLYHIIDRDESSRKYHFKSVEELFDCSDDERHSFFFPPRERMQLVDIPYEERQEVSESFRSQLYTITEEELEDLWDKDPTQAELAETYRRIAQGTSPNRTLKIQLTQRAGNEFQQMRKYNVTRAKRFERCFELMKDLYHLYEARHGSFSLASHSFHFFKTRRTAERPFYHTEPQSIDLLMEKAKKARIDTVIISGFAIEQDGGAYEPTGEELLQAYDPAEPTVPLESLVPAGASTDDAADEESVLVVPLGTTPMIATQLYTLLTAQQQTVKEVILVYPAGSLEVKNSVKMAQDAFKEEGVHCRPVPVQGYKDIDSREACKAYLQTLEATIDEFRQDTRQHTPYKVELALSGGRKGMAALAMFAAQHKGIRYIYHTLITDEDTNRKVERETNIDTLTSPRISKQVRNDRLFLRAYEGSGPYTKFVLFKVPVLPARV